MTKKQRRHVKPQEVALMRKYFGLGYTIVDIAAHFGFSTVTVSKVVNGKTHKEVPLEAADIPPLLTPEQVAARRERTRLALRGRRI